MISRSRRVSATDVALFVLGAFAAPVLITAVFRLPIDWPLWLPFSTPLATAALLWRSSIRAAAVGMVAGTIGWGALLYYLVATWGRGLESM